MYTKNKFSILYLYPLVFLAVAMQSPHKAEAATVEPLCIMAVATDAGIHVVRSQEDVYFKNKTNVILVWLGSNVTKAVNAKGVVVNLTGGIAVSPTVQTEYEYTFSNESGEEVTCAITLIPVTATITRSALVTKSENPTLSGTAEGIKTVIVELYEEGNITRIYASKILTVKNSKWTTKITKDLDDGFYTVKVIGDKNVAFNTLGTGTLQVGNIPPASLKVDTTLVVQNIPLLVGGVAHAGSLVPFAYVQILNVGIKQATFEGFEVQQLSSAPTASILSLSTVDDTGTLQSPIEGIAGALQFKNGLAFIPTKVVLEPGQMHLFTLKAALVNAITPYIGTQLKLVVSSIKTNAKNIRGTFPVPGTTWTIGY